MAIHIRREAPADYRTVEELVRESFWNVYHPGCTEHYVLHRYRNEPDFVPELDLVLEKGGEIIGQVIYVKSKIDLADGTTLPVMTFGPIGIAPQYKRQGYGKLLLDHSMEIAAKMDAGALCITGNILFYGKSGFAPASQFGVRYADADPADAVVPYFLAKELTPGYLNGVRGTYHDPDGYFVAMREPDAFARYDSTFPQKGKMRLPGQLA